MRDDDFHVEFGCEVGGEVLGAVDRTVLAAGAAEADLQVTEFPLDETLYMGIHEGVDAVEESQDFSVVLQEFDNLRIGAVELAVEFVLTGIVDAPAVKNIAAPVARIIRRDAFLEGETPDVHFQPPVFDGRIELREGRELRQDRVQICNESTGQRRI